MRSCPLTYTVLGEVSRLCGQKMKKTKSRRSGMQAHAGGIAVDPFYKGAPDNRAEELVIYTLCVF